MEIERREIERVREKEEWEERDREKKIDSYIDI